MIFCIYVLKIYGFCPIIDRLQTDKELESVIGETSVDGEWLPMKIDKENKVGTPLTFSNISLQNKQHIPSLLL